MYTIITINIIYLLSVKVSSCAFTIPPTHLSLLHPHPKPHLTANLLSVIIGNFAFKKEFYRSVII